MRSRVGGLWHEQWFPASHATLRDNARGDLLPQMQRGRLLDRRLELHSPRCQRLLEFTELEGGTKTRGRIDGFSNRHDWLSESAGACDGIHRPGSFRKRNGEVVTVRLKRF